MGSSCCLLPLLLRLVPSRPTSPLLLVLAKPLLLARPTRRGEGLQALGVLVLLAPARPAPRLAVGQASRPWAPVSAAILCIGVGHTQKTFSILARLS